MTGALGAVLVVAGLVSAPAHAAPHAVSASSSSEHGAVTAQQAHPYADYLAEPGTASGASRSAGSATATSGGNQCDLPLAARRGNWFCLDDKAGASTASRSGSAGSLAPQSAPGGYCDAKGCWTVVDDFHSRAYMSGSFGYGTKGLGDVYLDTPHSLNGAQMISKPSFNADTSTKTLHADGDLLAGSHTGSGSEVAGNYDIVSKSTLASGSVWKPFSGSGGYKSYDKSHLNHANVIEVTWEKTGYPGYWYLYQKSVIADDPNNNNVYGFNGPEYKFTSSAGSGYHSS